ncbi:MAG: hypothetical protein EHM49_00705 [Deltaproteobacteria bacterium]|nr:MAG: hypothetical protein EHM49_00705 [Deltaproteobacteria bacterium]
MADLIKFVDPGASGANDGTTWANAYTTMNAWEQAQNQDLVTNTSTMTCYFRSSGAHAADTTVFAINGWTTSATYWIKVLHGQWQDPVDGSTEALGGAYYNTGQYRLEGTNDVLCISEDYVTVQGLQVRQTGATSAGKSPISVSGITATNNLINIAYCYAQTTTDDTYATFGLYLIDSDLIVNVWNCAFWHRRPTPSSTDQAIYLRNAAGSVIYNVTGYGGYNAFKCYNANSITAKNCLGFNTSNSDFVGTFNAASDYNVSEDATAPNGGGHSSQIAGIAGYFDSEATGDFRLNQTVGVGTDLSGIFTDDMEKATRVSWDAGGDEFLAAGVEVSAGTDSLVITEYAANINAEINIAAGVDALAITEYPANVNAEISIEAGVDALTLTEYPANVNAEVSIAAGVDELAIAEYPATVNAEVNISAGVDELTLAEQPATVNAEINISAVVDELTLTEQPATVNYGVNIDADCDSLTLTEYEATVNAAINIQASVDALEIETFQATVATGEEPVEILATCDTFSLTEYPASVQLNVNVDATTDELLLSVFSATINAAHNIQANVDTLTITEFPAIISVKIPARINEIPKYKFNPFTKNFDLYAPARTGIASYKFLGWTAETPPVTDPGTGNFVLNDDGSDYQLVINITDKNGRDLLFVLMMLFFLGWDYVYDIWFWMHSKTNPTLYYGLWMSLEDIEAIEDGEENLLAFIIPMYPMFVSMTYDPALDEWTALDIPVNDEVVLSMDFAFNPDYIGSMGEQDSDAVSIYGGSISGISLWGGENDIFTLPYKSTTGDPEYGYNRQIYVNDVDKLVRVYLDGTWRTLLDFS